MDRKKWVLRARAGMANISGTSETDMVRTRGEKDRGIFINEKMEVMSGPRRIARPQLKWSYVIKRHE